MWDTLAPPWQAALEMAWEAYCAGTIPIGAVIADADGNVVARGRNRVYDKSAPDRQVCDDMLAHAEINALLALDINQESRHHAALYTTMEPCPLCMGAFYMSSVRTLRFAAHDPWAGSVNLLGTTPYLSRKPIRVFPPFDPDLEIALTAMCVLFDINTRGEGILKNRFFDNLRETLPKSVETGIALYRSGKITQFKEKNTGSQEVFEYLSYQVK